MMIGWRQLVVAMSRGGHNQSQFRLACLFLDLVVVPVAGPEAASEETQGEDTVTIGTRITTAIALPLSLSPLEGRKRHLLHLHLGCFSALLMRMMANPKSPPPSPRQ